MCSTMFRNEHKTNDDESEAARRRSYRRIAKTIVPSTFLLKKLELQAKATRPICKISKGKSKSNPCAEFSDTCTTC